MSTFYRITGIIFFVAFGCQAVLAQSSYLKDENGVLIQRTGGAVRFDVCSNHIIRVRIADEDSIPERKSLVVNHQWEKVPFKITETSKAIELSTADLVVQINKSGDEIAFCNRNKQVILKQLAKNIQKTQVSGNDTKNLAVTFSFSKEEAV
jgi:hypothetical protein